MIPLGGSRQPFVPRSPQTLPFCLALTRASLRSRLSSSAFVGPAPMLNFAARCSPSMKIEGMAGECAPLGYFDPFGFSKDASPETMKKCAACCR